MDDQKPRQRTLRCLRRFNQPGAARFLTFSCFQNRPFLRSTRACRWLADSINRASQKHLFSLWAYVFMPTHVHLLLLPHRERPDVGPILASIKVSAARRAINWTKVNRPRSLDSLADRSPTDVLIYRFWQRGAGYDRNLVTPHAIWESVDYIHSNPVADKLCTTESEWEWSSAEFHRTGQSGLVEIDLTGMPGRPT